MGQGFKITKLLKCNTEYIRPNSNLSASYYLKAHDNYGEFKVTNPHAVRRDKFPGRDNPTELNRLIAKHKVEERDLLIFPSCLPQSVLPNKSEEDRMVVSFNSCIDR